MLSEKIKQNTLKDEDILMIADHVNLILYLLISKAALGLSSTSGTSDDRCRGMFLLGDGKFRT